MSTPSVSKMMMVSAISNVLVVNDDISDTEPFEVALVETTYTVDESVGSVSVCVNPTRPQVDILDETVNVCLSLITHFSQHPTWCSSGK